MPCRACEKASNKLFPPFLGLFTHGVSKAHRTQEVLNVNLPESVHVVFPELDPHPGFPLAVDFGYRLAAVVLRRPRCGPECGLGSAISR